MSASQNPSATTTTPTQPLSWMKRVKANKIVTYSPRGLHYATTPQDIIDMLEFDRLLRLPNAMVTKYDIPMSYRYFSTQVNNDPLIHPAKFATFDTQTGVIHGSTSPMVDRRLFVPFIYNTSQAFVGHLLRDHTGQIMGDVAPKPKTKRANFRAKRGGRGVWRDRGSMYDLRSDGMWKNNFPLIRGGFSSIPSSGTSTPVTLNPQAADDSAHPSDPSTMTTDEFFASLDLGPMANIPTPDLDSFFESEPTQTAGAGPSGTNSASNEEMDVVNA